jgi:ABC-type transporter Mla MlaB component
MPDVRDEGNSMEVPSGPDGHPTASPLYVTGLEVYPLGERPGLRVVGEVSVTTRPLWRDALNELAQRGQGAVHVDLDQVAFIDVGGVTDLVMCAQALPVGRWIVVHQPPRQLPRILDTLWPGLDVIEVAP